MKDQEPSGRKERRLMESLRKKGKQKRNEDGRGTPKQEASQTGEKGKPQKRWKGNFGFQEKALLACAALYCSLRFYIWLKTGELSLM